MRVPETVEAWWERVQTSAPPGLVGLWFGLVELVPGGWSLYVAGTKLFDSLDESAEWAASPYAWWPADSYFAVPQMADLDVPSAVAAASDLVRSLSPWVAVPVAGVAVGFDDGDFAVVYDRATSA